MEGQMPGVVTEPGAVVLGPLSGALVRGATVRGGGNVLPLPLTPYRSSGNDFIRDTIIQILQIGLTRCENSTYRPIRPVLRKKWPKTFWWRSGRTVNLALKWSVNSISPKANLAKMAWPASVYCRLLTHLKVWSTYSQIVVFTLIQQMPCSPQKCSYLSPRTPVHRCFGGWHRSVAFAISAI